MNSSTFVYSSDPARRTLPPLPGWLADEADLADEAVLFGLSEARPDERIAQIRLAFAERTIFLEKQIEQAQEQVGELNLAIEAAQSRLGLLETGPPMPDAGRWFSVAGQRLSLRLGLSLMGSVGAVLGMDTLFPAPAIGLLLGGLVGVGGIGAALIRYGFDQKLRLEQHRAARANKAVQLASVNAEIIDYQRYKADLINELYQHEAHRDGQYAHRDRLVRLFDSEFDLARSLRYSLKPDDAPYV